jgi:hypothetical protein
LASNAAFFFCKVLAERLGFESLSAAKTVLATRLTTKTTKVRFAASASGARPRAEGNLRGIEIV